MRIGQDKSWCVLRMSGPATLGVASALNDMGFEAWTPAQVTTRRVGRDRRKVDRPAALLPSFAFAHYGRLSELVAIARSPSQTFLTWDTDLRRMVTKGIPHFSLMRHDGRYIAVSDRSLDMLRLAERRSQPLHQIQMLEPGEMVKCPDAGFEGLVGVVQTTKGRRALVLFEGLAIPVSIPTHGLLRHTA